MESFSILLGMIFWPMVIIGWIIPCRRRKFSRRVVAIGSLLVFGLPLLGGASMAHWMFVNEPLYDAVSEGDTERVKTLLAWGGNPNLEVEGDSLLVAAAYNGNIEVVRMLLARGADAAARNGHDGLTAVGAAKKNGHLEVARLLEKEKARE